MPVDNRQQFDAEKKAIYKFLKQNKLSQFNFRKTELNLEGEVLKKNSSTYKVLNPRIRSSLIGRHSIYDVSKTIKLDDQNQTINIKIKLAGKKEIAKYGTKEEIQREYKLGRRFLALRMKIILDSEDGYLLMREIEGLTVDGYLDKRLEQNTLDDYLQLALSVLKMVKEIHDHDLIHRDIKGENAILKNNNPNLVVSIDFGSAKDVYDTDKLDWLILTEVPGDPSYVAPELIILKGSSQASDIYTTSYMLVRIINLGLSLIGDKENITDIEELIKKDHIDSINECLKGMRKLMPSKRYSIDKCIAIFECILKERNALIKNDDVLLDHNEALITNPPQDFATKKIHAYTQSEAKKFLTIVKDYIETREWQAGYSLIHANSVDEYNLWLEKMLPKVVKQQLILINKALFNERSGINVNFVNAMNVVICKGQDESESSHYFSFFNSANEIKSYFEIFNNSPFNIMNLLIEQGCKFKHAVRRSGIVL